MAADVTTLKPWAVPPEKIAEAVSRLVAVGNPQQLHAPTAGFSMTAAERARLLMCKSAQELTELDRLIRDPVIEAATLGFHVHPAETLSEDWPVA